MPWTIRSAASLMVIALACYTTGVWSERLAGRLQPWHAVVTRWDVRRSSWSSSTSKHAVARCSRRTFVWVTSSSTSWLATAPSSSSSKCEHAGAAHGRPDSRASHQRSGNVCDAPASASGVKGSDAIPAWIECASTPRR